MGTELEKLIEGQERNEFAKWLDRCNELGLPKKPIDAWVARSTLSGKCRGVAHPDCNYLAPCGSVCTKCGQQV